MSEQGDQEETYQAWLAALNSAETLERCDAAESPPEGVDDARVVAALIPLLADDSALVRASAAESLGLYPVPGVAEALRTLAATETDELARAYALSSLGLIGTAVDINTLACALENVPEQVAIHALAGLHELTRRLAKERLAAYLAHERAEVRSAAAGALGQVVNARDDVDALAALRAQLVREPAAGNRADLQAVITDVWGNAEADADTEADAAMKGL